MTKLVLTNDNTSYIKEYLASRILDINIHLNDTWLGKLNPNEASVELDNSDDEFTIDTNGNLVNSDNVVIDENLKAEIYIDGIKKFTGYVAKRPRIGLKNKQIKLTFKDYWRKIERKYCTNTVFLNADFLTVLNTLVQMGGEDLANTNFEDPGLTIKFWHVNEDTKVVDAITKLVQSVGGQIYYDENGILIFKAGFASTFSTSTVATLTVSKINDLDIAYPTEQYSCVVIKSKYRTLSSNLDIIYVGATPDSPLDIPINGLPESEDDSFYAQLDNPIWYLGDYADVIFEAPDGVTLNQTVYENNFQDIANNIPNNPFKLALQIDNTTGSEQQVTDFRVFGKQVIEDELRAYYPLTPDLTRKYEFESDLISNETWATKLAKWLYEELVNRPEITTNYQVFSEGLNFHVGDKVLIYETSTGLSHRYIIKSIDINYKSSKIALSLRQDREAFVNPTIVKQTIQTSVPTPGIVLPSWFVALTTSPVAIGTLTITLSKYDPTSPDADVYYSTTYTQKYFSWASWGTLSTTDLSYNGSVSRFAVRIHPATSDDGVYELKVTYGSYTYSCLITVTDGSIGYGGFIVGNHAYMMDWSAPNQKDTLVVKAIFEGTKTDGNAFETTSITSKIGPPLQLYFSFSSELTGLLRTFLALQSRLSRETYRRYFEETYRKMKDPNILIDFFEMTTAYDDTNTTMYFEIVQGDPNKYIAIFKIRGDYLSGMVGRIPKLLTIQQGNHLVATDNDLIIGQPYTYFIGVVEENLGNNFELYPNVWYARKITPS